MKIEITKCSDQDKNEFREFYDKLPVEQKGNLEFRFEDKNETFFVIKIDDRIVGIMSVSISGKSYVDFRRFVLPEFRRARIAEMMLNYLILHARKNNISRIMGTIRNSSVRGVEYLQNRGFKITPYNGNDLSCVILKL